MGRNSIKDMRRREIIAAFARVLAQHGYAGATINAVAAEADLSPGLLHHNFKSKQEMLIELFATLTRKFRQRVQDQTSHESNPIASYMDAALKLDERADYLSAKCWVGLFSEALREPILYERIKRYLDQEIKYWQNED